MKMLNKQKGFTLIELVIVLVVLGILAALIVPRLTDVTDTAKTVYVQSVQSALNTDIVTSYASTSGQFPSGTDFNAFLGDIKNTSGAAITPTYSSNEIGMTGTPGGDLKIQVYTESSGTCSSTAATFSDGTGFGNLTNICKVSVTN